MIVVLLTALSVCPTTLMENRTSFPWNDYDREMLRYSEKRCGEIYPDASCVVLFRKWGKQDYSVVCGRKEKAEPS